MVKIKDHNLKVQITALTCGMAGIMLASYGNGVFGQMPTGILMYVSMVFMFIAPKIDKIKQEKKKEVKKVNSKQNNNKNIKKKVLTKKTN